MHLGSVLLGIVAGLAVGVLVGWLAGSRRRPRSPEEAGFGRKGAAEDPGWNLPAPVVQSGLAAEPAVERSALPVDEAKVPAWSPHPALAALEQEPLAPEREPDHTLLDTLRAASRRLTDDTEARLSRQAEDIPADAADRSGSGGAHSAGQDLLELSRRLAEDSARRLKRNSEPAG